MRVIQDKKFQRLGCNQTRHTDTRIVAATNRNLEELIEQDLFRKDLYYRLNTHHIQLPPLRERLDDIPLLVDSFLEQSAKELGRKKPTPPRELYTLLSTYAFPGNVRELRSMVYDAVSRHNCGTLSLDVFRKRTGRSEYSKQRTQQTSLKDNNNRLVFDSPLPTLKDVENQLIEEAL